MGCRLFEYKLYNDALWFIEINDLIVDIMLIVRIFELGINYPLETWVNSKDASLQSSLQKESKRLNSNSQKRYRVIMKYKIHYSFVNNW